MSILDLYVGDEPTLVRYMIAFTKPGFEVFFQEEEELVSDRIRLLEYVGLAIASFLSQAAIGHIPVPVKWRAKDYPPYVNRTSHSEGWLIPESDIQHLKFHTSTLFKGKRLSDLDIFLTSTRPALFRYNILFTKPGNQAAFPEMAELFTEKISILEFGCRAIIDFLYQIERGSFERPRKWVEKNYPPGNSNQYFNSIPEEDKRYIEFSCDLSSASNSGIEIISSRDDSRERKSESYNDNEQCVFIGHGRSPLWARLQIFLEKDLRLNTVSYESESRVGEQIVSILEQMLGQATFAVLILTAEDETAEGARRARQNVIHEAGLFQGKLGFRRAVVLRQEGAEDFSNIAGLQYISFSGNGIDQTFHQLRKVLEKEGLI
jgi:predicted nucleotide-binding protein